MTPTHNTLLGIGYTNNPQDSHHQAHSIGHHVRNCAEYKRGEMTEEATTHLIILFFSLTYPYNSHYKG